MSDVIWGDVIQVVDGDTFDVRVTIQSPFNSRLYDPCERIRLAGVDAPELPSAAGYAAGAALLRLLYAPRLGGHVRLEIQARDVFHRLVCKVSPASR